MGQAGSQPVDVEAQVQAPGLRQLDDLPDYFAQKTEPQAWVVENDSDKDDEETDALSASEVLLNALRLTDVEDVDEQDETLKQEPPIVAKENEAAEEADADDHWKRVVVRQQQLGASDIRQLESMAGEIPPLVASEMVDLEQVSKPETFNNSFKCRIASVLAS